RLVRRLADRRSNTWKEYPPMRSSCSLFFRFVRVMMCAACSALLAMLASCTRESDNLKDPRSPDYNERNAKPANENAKSAHSWPTFFGSPSRNPVNTTEKNIATEWNIEEGAQRNIKWTIVAGSRSYAGPVFANGRIFVGTNNEEPRDPKIKGDKGVLLCLDEATGKYLWQAIYDKLAAGRVVDWALQGIWSTAHVDGDRLYFISNRCEVICADVHGDPATKKVKEIWKLDMMKELGVFPHNLACSSPLVIG